MPGIATVAAQVWTTVTTQDLGLPTLPGTDRTCGTAAVQPLGMADMTDVLAAEHWPAEGGPRGLLYLCGPMAHYGPWPDAEAQPAEVDWALATYARARRARLALEAGDRPHGCGLARRALEVWAGAEAAVADAARELNASARSCPS